MKTMSYHAKTGALLAAVVLVFGCGPLSAATGELAVDVQEDGNSTRVHLDGDVFCDVIHGDETSYGQAPRPYVYPIYGPTGAMVTRNYPMDSGFEDEEHDHPHHRSLWFAHFVNGTDFWTQGEGRGRIVPDGEVTVTGDDQYCTVAMDARWIAPAGFEILRSTQVYGFTALEDGSRVIDVTLELTPGEDVEEAVFHDTKEGTMAIRTHPALRLVGDHAAGHALNSEGDVDRELWGKRAAWVAYWGEIDGEVCGVAIFDHPDNLRHPTWWHARDYGLIAANPFGIHDFERSPEGTGDFTLESGRTLVLRYRFVFFAGDAESSDIAGKYAAWLEASLEDAPGAGVSENDGDDSRIP